MPNTDNSAAANTARVRRLAASQGPTPPVRPNIGSMALDAQLGRTEGFSFAPAPITGLRSDTSPTIYNNPINITWNPAPDVTSYRVSTTRLPGYAAPITHTSPTSVSINYEAGNNGVIAKVTVTAYNSSGGYTDASIKVYPCFLAGSLVHMADGTTKAIEDVRVGDLVIGAFGEINKVLALHRPLLGSATMCKINDEHSTTNHHPHVSLNKQFYCGDPALVSSSTYGHSHAVIDGDGQTVERMLHGLKKERIQRLQVGVELKTIEGSRTTRTLETYPMAADTQLYNLVIDGSHTYHVDGYAVTGWPREDDFDYDIWQSV